MRKRPRITSAAGNESEPLPDELPTDCELEHTPEARRLKEREREQ